MPGKLVSGKPTPILRAAAVGTAIGREIGCTSTGGVAVAIDRPILSMGTSVLFGHNVRRAVCNFSTASMFASP